MNLDLLTSPISEAQIKAVTKFEFKNRLGDFMMVKEGSNWLLQKPRTIPAKVSTIQKIFKELENLTVQTIHEYEPINFRSFSLDNPIVEMNLSSNNESLNIKIGLMNPIDNTAYLVVSGRDQIYQTSMFKYQLESLELTDFVDSGVFSMPLEKIKKLTLYQGKNTQPNNVLELVNGNWISRKYNTISNASVDKKITNLLDIRTHMIVDKMNDELKTFMDNYLDNPIYRIIVDTKDGNKIIYKITSLIKGIQELKIERRQYFIMSASDRPYPFLIGKPYIDRFFIRYSDLK